jgi:hypothetical protein
MFGAARRIAVAPSENKLGAGAALGSRGFEGSSEKTGRRGRRWGREYRRGCHRRSKRCYGQRSRGGHQRVQAEIRRMMLRMHGALMERACSLPAKRTARRRLRVK